jgi:hypothetical protein
LNVFMRNSAKKWNWKELDGKTLLIQVNSDDGDTGCTVISGFEEKTGITYILHEEFGK